MYTIYHVRDVKIGCDSRYPKRCVEQGFKEGSFKIEDLVSDSCGAKFAGEVERFWQWYYGLPIDRVPYERNYGSTQTSDQQAENGRKGVESQLKSGTHNSQTGKGNTFFDGRAGRRTGELGKSGFQTGVAVRAANSIEYVCPWCEFRGKSSVMKRWHFDNCKFRSC
jgi:hypothetical protein